MNQEDAQKEGFQQLSEFLDYWRENFGGDFQEEVWVLEFKLVEPGITDKRDSASE